MVHFYAGMTGEGEEGLMSIDNTFLKIGEID
jgi:hypothetical protein